VPIPKPLTPQEARHSLAERLGPSIDRIRQIGVRLGDRPYRVFLVWTQFGGAQRGEGTERLYRRVEIVPTPVVADLTGLNRQAFSAGVFAVGSIRVSEISVAVFDEDVLYGRALPPNDRVPGDGTLDSLDQRFDFYYELYTDARDERMPRRHRFRLSSPPFLDADNVQWVVRLDRIDDDPARDGSLRPDDG
jgi:hypothetical protein